MDADKPRLTPKQKRFVEEYVAADGNATQAYFRAFGRYTAQKKRRTYKGAQVEAGKLLSKPFIQAEIKASQDEYVRRTRISKARVVRQVAELAFFDPADLYDEGPEGAPTPKPWGDVPPAARRAIASVKIKRKRLRDEHDSTEWEVEELEYKFAPKSAELDKLCKKLGFYEADQGPKPGERAVIELPSNGRDDG